MQQASQVLLWGLITGISLLYHVRRSFVRCHNRCLPGGRTFLFRKVHLPPVATQTPYSSAAIADLPFALHTTGTEFSSIWSEALLSRVVSSAVWSFHRKSGDQRSLRRRRTGNTPSLVDGLQEQTHYASNNFNHLPSELLCVRVFSDIKAQDKPFIPFTSSTSIDDFTSTTDTCYSIAERCHSTTSSCTLLEAEPLSVVHDTSVYALKHALLIPPVSLLTQLPLVPLATPQLPDTEQAKHACALWLQGVVPRHSNASRT